MKAKNNKTGEIVTNFGMSKEFGTISYIDSTNTLRFSTASDAEWTIIEEETFFDWQSFRAEAAKDILCTVLPKTKIIDDDFYQSIENTISNSIDVADELIKQLTEKDEKIEDSLISNASCDAVVKAVIEKGVVDEALDALSEADRENLFSSYGYTKIDCATEKLD